MANILSKRREVKKLLNPNRRKMEVPIELFPHIKLQEENKRALLLLAKRG
jgi:hypothetical protein